MGLRVLFAAVLAIATLGPSSGRSEAQLFRISTENTADHVQTRAVGRFATELQRRAGHRLTVRHDFAGELFRDRDVVKALRQGKLEMAVPGTWQLDRIEPSVGVFFLPAFYGRDLPHLDRLRDGETGREINRRIEDNLGLHVPGRWIDLGFAHIFGVNRTVRTHEDIKGLRIRVAGGEANLKRIGFLGAEPRVIPWADLPDSLRQGSVEGILSTHESIASARLWEHGVTSVFEDQEYFAQYVPLVAGSAWRRLSPELRRVIADVWEETVIWARAETAKAQAEARAELISHGVSVVRPTPDQLADQRRRLLSLQPVVVSTLGVDEPFVAKVMAELGESP